jgi:KaiC/GvpD/RAD55 family RecA-like ATPase
MKTVKDVKELLAYLSSMPENFIVLINVGAEDYVGTNVAILKALADNNKLPGVYITVNKPYTAMERLLEKEGVDTKNIYFIDCVTKMSGGEPGAGGKNVFFLDTPQNLTGLGVAMSEAITVMGEGDKFLLMDSLSTLLIYHSVGTVAKFSHFLTARMRTWGLKGILMAVEKDADPEFTNQLSQFCDGVVKIDKK